MTAYISVSFRKRKSLYNELIAITNVLNEFNIQALIFVDNYKFDSLQEQQMMQQAMADIENCEILIAETSDKGMGIGIEAGYAKAKGKPVIYIRQKDADHSTTLSGISDFKVIYLDPDDLQKKLTHIINQIKSTI